MKSKDYKLIHIYPSTFERLKQLKPKGVPLMRFLDYIVEHLPSKERLLASYVQFLNSQDDKGERND